MAKEKLHAQNAYLIGFWTMFIFPQRFEVRLLMDKGVIDTCQLFCCFENYFDIYFLYIGVLSWGAPQADVCLH